MRTLTIGLLAVAALGPLASARAADLDYDVLRGSESYEPAVPIIDWSGLYIGGHGGYSSAALGFKNVFQPVVASALRSTVIENEIAASSLLSTRAVREGGGSFGGFGGYNVQYDEAVLGIEFDYTRFDIGGTSTDAIGRSLVTSDGYFNAVGLSGTSLTKVRDYGTIRARAGYALGSLLPFVTAGLAIGRAQISDSVDVQAFGYDRATYLSNLATGGNAHVNRYGYASFDPANPGAGVPAAGTRHGSRTTKIVAGLALGAGLEYAITPNFLLRGEYQYVLFNDFDGHKVNLNTVRAGGAVKF